MTDRLKYDPTLARTPLTVELSDDEDGYSDAITLDSPDYSVAQMTCPWDNAQATAQKLALAYNCHDDLLAACVEAENALVDYVEMLEKRGGLMGYGRATIKQVQDAIAKARGEK